MMDTGKTPDDHPAWKMLMHRKVIFSIYPLTKRLRNFNPGNEAIIPD